MFIRSFAAIVLVLPTLSSAISVLSNNDAIGFGSTDGVQPTIGTQDPTTIGRCNTGTLQCCDQVQSASYSAALSPTAFSYDLVYFFVHRQILAT